MRHRGTKQSRPQHVHGYAWYDWETGDVDLCKLAAEACREPCAPEFLQPPAWLTGIATHLTNPSLTDLACIDAQARRAYVHREQG